MFGRFWRSTVFVLQPFPKLSDLWGTVVTLSVWLGLGGLSAITLPNNLSARIALLVGFAAILAFIAVIRLHRKLEQEPSQYRRALEEALIGERSSHRHGLFEATATVVSDGERLANLSKTFTHIDWRKNKNMVRVRDDLKESVKGLRVAVNRAVKSVPTEALSYQRVCNNLFSVLDKSWNSGDLVRLIGPFIDTLAKLNEAHVTNQIQELRELRRNELTSVGH